jgi:hypothetical protein
MKAEMIQFESDEMLVVNKPATIPVHPCGAYRHNAMVKCIMIHSCASKNLSSYVLAIYMILYWKLLTYASVSDIYFGT